MNKATIHQPNYIPYLGLFDKIAQCNTFIILDTADYTKNGFMNRNKIRTNNGWCWLTIPIERDFYRRPCHEVFLPQDESWKEKHWKTIQTFYEKAPYFDKHRKFFENMFTADFWDFTNFNYLIINYMLEAFNIDVDIIFASQLDLKRSLKGTDHLLDILRKVGADVYLSGSSGNAYLETEKFTDIKLEMHNFFHPTYKQMHEPFIPHLSAIDYLFNCEKPLHRKLLR